ncbi:MAG TPA: amylo-alpha-1,6-glucosidase [Candidatus Binataceae bacterium]|nr:amylo-alpha-1,6-glucosidase [Candidatus Binataceae bacterium]
MKRRDSREAGANNNGADGQARRPRNLLKVGSEFYILASALGSRRSPRVLASGQSFAVFDLTGDILDYPLEPLGFFWRDTRYLSRCELKIYGSAPCLLNSYLSDDRAQLRVNLTNPDLKLRGGEMVLPRDLIQMERSWVLDGATLVHRLRLRNYAGIPLDIPLEFFLAADFADIFEVRGIDRLRRGRALDPVPGAASLRLGYQGLDGVKRFTEVSFDAEPRALGGERAAFQIELAPDQSRTLELRVAVGSERAAAREGRGASPDFDRTLAMRRTAIERAQGGFAAISCGNELFDALLKRSRADLLSLIAQTDTGTFMMAGIPWFATLFGRDSLVTAMALLPFNPQLAAQTLRALAAMQGTRIDEGRDEQPGKIVHEIRKGEMARTGEIPFARYYGSIDATPLFLWLYGRCIMTTGDLALADELWPNVERALEWIERWGDRDGDGYVEYIREAASGLANQGWKDSGDAISHADGQLADPPVALAEVQGYVYAAYLVIAEVAGRLGRAGAADRLAERAARLRQAFVRDFWLDGEGTVALALDGRKQPCRVMASNAAHCLAAGLLDPERARRQSQRLMEDRMFSGWGLRTLSADERRYNPMSYHNGSVWPHDNAIAAIGLARAGYRADALRILQGLFDAAVHLESASLPELFCGFAREAALGPVPYPVACYPQAWSAASVFMMLQAALGLEIIGCEQRVVMDAPAIPSWLDWLKLENVQVGDGSVSLLVRRGSDGAAVTEVLRKSGAVVVDSRQ